MAKIAIMGHGVVGSGVAEVLLNNADVIQMNAQQPIEIKRILDLRSFSALSYHSLFTTSFEDILEDDEISVVCETMGGVEPAYSFTKRLLEQKKSVVTSNKELVSKKGAELFAIAKNNHVNYFYEASVGGGIPIIHPLQACLTGNRIESVMGILNGTTNYILTNMIDDNQTFQAALSSAQELGYAEKDPSDDIDGSDACRKIAILASLCFGKEVHPENIHQEGIEQVTLDDVSYARSWGGEIKLIASVKKLGKDDSLAVFVEPVFLPKQHPLASVDDVFNGIMVTGNAVGELLFVGKGAGKLPTASAVVSDIIEAVKTQETNLNLQWQPCSQCLLFDYEQHEANFYLRFQCQGERDSSKIFDEFSNALELSHGKETDNEIALQTDVIKIAELNAKLRRLAQRDIILLSKMRMIL